MELLYFWIGLAIITLIVEAATATFYGLAIALASAIVALYVWVIGDTSISLMQGMILLIGSILFSVTLPNYLKPSGPDTPQGVDKYLGMKRSVKKIGSDMKITLDGVDYIVESDTDLNSGDKVEVTGHAGASMRVKKSKG